MELPKLQKGLHIIYLKVLSSKLFISFVYQKALTKKNQHLYLRFCWIFHFFYNLYVLWLLDLITKIWPSFTKWNTPLVKIRIIELTSREARILLNIKVEWNVGLILSILNSINSGFHLNFESTYCIFLSN